VRRLNVRIRKVCDADVLGDKPCERQWGYDGVRITVSRVSRVTVGVRVRICRSNVCRPNGVLSKSLVGGST